MRRFNVTYTVPEDEYEDELARLLRSSKEYIGSYSDAIDASVSLLESGNAEGCLASLAQIRDDLTAADHRLHDAMNLIGGYIQITRSPAPPVEPVEEVVVTGAFNEKMAALKESAKSLGLQLSETEMKEMLERANDSVS